MKLEAIVRLDGGVAHFAISPAGPGMYYADLVRFSGKAGKALPSRIILLRSIRHWAGSSDNDYLLKELGQVIDAAVQEAPIFNQETTPRRKSPSGQRRNPGN